MDPSRSGQMNLLEEILDSLNTTGLDQGKLSAAKSLDFFRSMDELDYKTPVCKTGGVDMRIQRGANHQTNKEWPVAQIMKSTLSLLFKKDVSYFKYG